MKIELIDQDNIKKKISSKLVQMKTEMDKRKAVWGKISVEKKKAWIASGKDPIMNVAWANYKYLRDNFFGEEL